MSGVSLLFNECMRSNGQSCAPLCPQFNTCGGGKQLYGWRWPCWLWLWWCWLWVWFLQLALTMFPLLDITQASLWVTALLDTVMTMTSINTLTLWCLNLLWSLSTSSWVLERFWVLLASTWWRTADPWWVCSSVTTVVTHLKSHEDIYSIHFPHFWLSFRPLRALSTVYTGIKVFLDFRHK